MPPDSTVSAEDKEQDGLLRQRDLAVVCAILAAATIGVISWNNFGKEDHELAAALQAVHQHRELLVEHQKIMTAVNATVMANQDEVARLNRAR